MSPELRAFTVGSPTSTPSSHATDVRYWMDTIRQHGNPTGVEKVLVGNKVDLPAPKVRSASLTAPHTIFRLKQVVAELLQISLA